jgi:hypothetical protein
MMRLAQNRVKWVSVDQGRRLHGKSVAEVRPPLYEDSRHSTADEDRPCDLRST